MTFKGWGEYGGARIATEFLRLGAVPRDDRHLRAVPGEDTRDPLPIPLLAPTGELEFSEARPG